MAKSTKVIPSKRRSPGSGKDPMVAARLPPELTARIEAWAETHDVSRSEAIRKLVEQALEVYDLANRKKRR
jgi:metal-responsive CopG/Arc/MetJ family transcriptional regulator